MIANRWIGISITLMLTACVSPKPASEAPQNKTMPVAERKAQTATISSWDITGAIAAKSQNKAWTASLNWHQQGANTYQIRLFGPVGGGTVMIEKKGSIITYKDGPKTVSSHSADQLLYKETGIRLPVHHLYYWVRGIPAPGKIQSAKYDSYNHLTTLKQAGYTIHYPKYTSIKQIDLPSKIQLQGNGVQMKLVIKKWAV